mmetsp:Transcript_8263/g.24847  ORF Transcript_8263/g.24847 Transcript_8263/m.24847 type:complete len:240 (+) Transcript_8263:477-1196(+)
MRRRTPFLRRRMRRTCSSTLEASPRGAEEEEEIAGARLRWRHRRRSPGECSSADGGGPRRRRRIRFVSPGAFRTSVRLGALGHLPPSRGRRKRSRGWPCRTASWRECSRRRIGRRPWRRRRRRGRSRRRRLPLRQMMRRRPPPPLIPLASRRGPTATSPPRRRDTRFCSTARSSVVRCCACGRPPLEMVTAAWKARVDFWGRTGVTRASRWRRRRRRARRVPRGTTTVKAEQWRGCWTG